MNDGDPGQLALALAEERIAVLEKLCALQQDVLDGTIARGSDEYRYARRKIRAVQAFLGLAASGAQTDVTAEPGHIG